MKSATIKLLLDWMFPEKADMANSMIVKDCEFTNSIPDRYHDYTIMTENGPVPAGNFSGFVPSLMQMINMRMHVKWGEKLFDFIDAYRISAERVVVFVVHNEQPVTLLDDGNMFPSDTLITQLRLLRG